MPDGILLNSGVSGDVLATHEASAISAVGLQQYELVQLVTGTGLVKSFVSSTNPYPVFLAGQASATQNVHIASQSATLNVAASLIAGAANIGSINNISATVNVQGSVITIENLSSTRTIATISAVTFASIIAAPGATSAVRVFSIMATNKSTTLTRVKFAESVTTNVRVMGDAALGGGGFFWKPRRSWLLPVNTAFGAFVSPAASDIAVSIEYIIE